jgi:hypothetical protein
MASITFNQIILKSPLQQPQNIESVDGQKIAIDAGQKKIALEGQSMTWETAPSQIVLKFGDCDSLELPCEPVKKKVFFMFEGRKEHCIEIEVSVKG